MIPRLAPGLCLLDRFDEDHAGHLSKESLFLGQTEKLVRKYQSIHGVFPTHQTLHADDFARRHCHLRLIVIDQLPMGDGSTKLFRTVRMWADALEATMANI